MGNKHFITNSLTINADISIVYSVLTDIENWNLWTKSISKISFIDDCKFEVGGKVQVIQPKLSPAIWTITEIIENKCFTWQTKILGVKMTAKHILESTPHGTVVELKMIYEGFLAGLFYKLTSKLTTRYLTMEVNGLKSECEKLK